LHGPPEAQLNNVLEPQGALRRCRFELPLPNQPS
jgi:hypothetical protein